MFWYLEKNEKQHPKAFDAPALVGVLYHVVG